MKSTILTVLCGLLLNCLALQAQKEITLKRIQVGPHQQEYKLAKIGHYFVLNGDIIMADDFPNTRSYVRMDPQTFALNLWPQGYIPIAISPDVIKWDMYKTVLKALESMQQQTHLRFRPRTTEADYIKLEMYLDDPLIGGLSAVGRQGGEQLLFLNKNQPEAVVIHEMLHALGFWHEQSRSDRNTYVRVNTDKVAKGYEDNFQMEPGLALGAYDYQSIMHYPADAFAATSGVPTIQCKNGDVISNCPLGGAKLSPKDIEGLNKLFAGSQSYAKLNLTQAFNIPLTQVSGKIIENGVYRIKVRSTAKYLDIKDISKNNGAILQQWDQFTADNQKFAITSVGNQLYEIKAMHSGRYLSVDRASLDNLATIIQWDYANQDNQRFYILYAENVDGYVIQGRQSGKYWGLLGLNNGGVIIQQEKALQVFSFERLGNIPLSVSPHAGEQIPSSLPRRGGGVIIRKKQP
ncbi:M12 family metallopeptidase [Paraflavitalea pollutisoli]|uniref:M12 family metallopeptidase n=1 Tax=Paraflavitalea pollutisoli TaxID=3034143 RepID=UPI0023ECC202|nr:M12 family metallopeptidase [Paraflavitalea sp. H1-2-19X]